ncbi:MAG TPA: hypothetical protein VJG64_00510 [Candidatus Paceibacterota bacterium]
MRVGVFQCAQIGLENRVHFSVFDGSVPVKIISMSDLAKHPLFAFLAHQPMMRELNVPEKVYSLVVLNYFHFIRMQPKLEFFLQELFDGGEQFFKSRFVAGNENKIVGVADVMLYLQFLFNKLVKLVHVHVGKELRSQIADGHASRVKEVRAAGLKAVNDFFQQLHYFRILDPPRQYCKQYLVIDAVKKLPDIALQGITLSCAVAAHSAKHLRQSPHAPVRALANAARKGVGNEAWFENRIEHFENRVMQHTVAHRSFVNMSAFRISDVEAGIRPMLVYFVSKVSVQLKNILLHLLLEIHYVCLVSLLAFKYVPCHEQMFGRGHSLEYSLVRFHI